jgi:hypothetical protein
MPEPERIDRRRAALIAYDVCRRALTPSDAARRAAMRPLLDAWIQIIAVARTAGVPVIYTTPVSRSDGADVVMLPTDLSGGERRGAAHQRCRGDGRGRLPRRDRAAARGLRLPQAPAERFYGTGVAELLHISHSTVRIGLAAGGSRIRTVSTA